MQIKSKSQSSLEYLLVMGIALFILAAAISYAIYYQVGYNSAGSAQNLQLAAESIANAITSISSGGVGSSHVFTFTSPGLDPISSICNTSLSLSYNGEEASQSLPVYTTGILPIAPGTYTGKVTMVKENGKAEAQLMMDLPISFISTSYTYNPSSIFYNVSFFDYSNSLVGNVNFTVIIYNDNNIVAEQNESTISGYYSGSITPTNGQFLPNSVAEIYVKSLGIISPSCFLPQELLFVPSNVINYLPLTITNDQNSPTPSPFQQEVVIDSADYQQYESSGLSNVEFFYPNGSVINSWLESGNSNTAVGTVYWLKLNEIPAHSSETVYMGFASKSTNLFNTINDGEAPQLSSTYGEYNDIGNVMNSGLEYQIYYDPSGTCDSGSYQDQVYSATLNNGVTINSCASMSSSTNAFYTSLSGSSQDVDGTTENNVIMNYQEGYSGGTAYPKPPVSNNANSWIIKAIGWAVVNSPTTFYVGSDDGIALGSVQSAGSGNGAYWLGGTSNPNNLVSEWHIEGFTSNSSTISTQGVYRMEMDYYEDGGGAYTAIWSNNPIDYYSPSAPPNGMMPTVTIGTIQPQITVFVNGVKDGNNGISSSTTMNVTAFGIHASHIGLMINGTVVSKLGSASLSYQKTMPPGLYNITVFSNQSNLANQTYWEAVANIPSGITNFVPISITNQQSTATSSPFQQDISINSFSYHNFENGSLSNVEFFSSSGNTIPSWLESGDTAYFNGKTYATLPVNYPYSMGSSFTISVWFKTTSDGVILGNGNDATVGGSSCYSPTLFVNQNGDIAGGDLAGTQPFDTNYFVANGKWTLVTITQTPSEQILYINGDEIASYKLSSGGSLQTCPTTYWAIGSENTGGWSGAPGGDFNFTGYISNLQFYNQVFTPSKVVLLYDEGIAGIPQNNSGLIAWYLLSGNTTQQNGHNSFSATGNLQFNGTSSASTSTNYWLKLGSIQPRESYIVFVGFALPNISLFNTTNDGEAPQLSSTYAEYDDGANVFNYYSNFAGTSLPSGWLLTQSTSGLVTVDNGLNINEVSQTSSYAGITLQTPISSNDIFEADIKVISVNSSNWAFGIGLSLGDNGGTNAYIYSTQNGGLISCAGISGGCGFASGGGSDLTSGIAGIMWNSTNSVVLSQNYASVQLKPSYLTSYGSVYPQIGGSSNSAGQASKFTWVRVRAYPPNGVMPKETVGYLNGQAS